LIFTERVTTHPGGDVGQIALHAVDLADRRRLAGRKIDLMQRAAGEQPGGIAALAVRQDVEGHRARGRDAELADRVEHAVVRRCLLDQAGDGAVDIEQRRLLGALERVDVGAGDDVGLLALVHVAKARLAPLNSIAAMTVENTNFLSQFLLRWTIGRPQTFTRGLTFQK